ncbi:hypothetical protein HanIR_Chr11g0523111 [Helianthus annuus]|nr:hypothetical protein HanIR_Chr11g0523111 [Helianthus annuus]
MFLVMVPVLLLRKMFARTNTRSRKMSDLFKVLSLDLSTVVFKMLSSNLSTVVSRGFAITAASILTVGSAQSIVIRPGYQGFRCRLQTRLSSSPEKCVELLDASKQTQVNK